MAIDLSDVEDFATGAAEAMAQYEVKFILSPDLMSKDPFCLARLEWNSIPYGDEHIDEVPDDRRGIYAFCVCKESPVLPMHCYVMYIGIAGRKSNRSLRARYREYLNAKKVLKRARIARMIGTWNSVLRFYFAPIDEDITSAQLEQIEEELNSALLPPMSEGDIEAGIKNQRRAFR